MGTCMRDMKKMGKRRKRKLTGTTMCVMKRGEGRMVVEKAGKEEE